MPAWNSASAPGSISATARQRGFWGMARMVEQVGETASPPVLVELDSVQVLDHERARHDERIELGPCGARLLVGMARLAFRFMSGAVWIVGFVHELVEHAGSRREHRRYGPTTLALDRLQPAQRREGFPRLPVLHDEAVPPAEHN